MTEARLKVRAGPYDWAALIGFLATRAIPGVEAVDAGHYRRTIAVAGGHGWIEVRPDTARNPRTLIATMALPEAAALPEVLIRLARLFDLETDPGPVGAHLSRDPHFVALVLARPGLRVPGAWDGFELGVRAILGQQVTVRAATGLAGKLVAGCGTPLLPPGGCAPPGGLTAVFPAPAQVADVDVAAMIGMPRARGAALRGLALRASEDPHLFVGGNGLAAGVARLREIPGVGEWTAQYIAMRAMREPDAFPAGDVGLLRAIGRPSSRELLLRAENWRPWRAYAAMHLWASEGLTSYCPSPHAPDHG